MVIFYPSHSFIRVYYGMARSSTTFGEDTQPSRRRGKSGKTLVLEGIKAAMPLCETREQAETLFFKEVAKRAFSVEDKDSAMLLKWMGDKGWASLKAVLEPVTFEYPEDGTRLEKADAVLLAMAKGIIPADVGSLFLRSNEHVSNVEIDTKIKQELEEIKQHLGLAND